MDCDNWCMLVAIVVVRSLLSLKLPPLDEPNDAGRSQSGRALLDGTERERKGSVLVTERVWPLRPLRAMGMEAEVGRIGSETAPAPAGITSLSLLWLRRERARRPAGSAATAVGALTTREGVSIGANASSESSAEDKNISWTSCGRCCDRLCG